MTTLFDRTGLFFEYRHFESAKDAFEALRKEEVHFVWLHPVTYVAAAERDLIQPIFVTNHFGLYEYGFQFITNIDSNFFSYFDPGTNLSTNALGTSLRQFEGKRPCFVNDSSISRSICPIGILRQNGIETLDPVYLQSHTGIVRALYIKGICDFGVTFAYTGDPRTSSSVINDLPDAIEQINIVWRSDQVIPSLSFAAHKDIPIEIIEKVQIFFSVFIQSNEGKDLLTKSLRYDVQDLKQVDASFYDQVQSLIFDAGIVPYQHLGY